MLTVRDAIPKPRPLASAEFAALRMRPIKIAKSRPSGIPINRVRRSEG